MRIERIELNGFKSFAEKTVFKFHPGITAIVGPNGCGKSNIVDAFKWVLGEQSAKSLRGGSMEDVIFAGSATKKTKGMAEVTLVLSDIIMNPSNGSDNNGSEDKQEDKKDTAAISVTRRLFRSGESEYLMNKVPCRLKDIRNMFLDTGLELKAYSILEQGSIGDIVNSRPQDRRFLIEEIAGVMKYKVRKHEATNKLEASKANLQRLQDIIAEVRRQINIINRHAKKAERYREIHERIRDIEIRKAKRDMKALQADISGLVSSEEGLRAREAELSANVHSADALIEEKKRTCVEQERSLSEIRSRLYALEKETTEDQGRIALLRSDCTNLRDRYSGLRSREGALDAEKEETIAALRDLAADETETARELSGLEEILREKKALFSESESGITELESELEDRRRDLFNKAEEISNARNEINHLNLSIENISRKAEKNSRDIDSLNTNLAAVKTKLRQAEDERVRTETELLEARKAREELTGALRDRKAELSGNEEALYREREQLAAMVSKLESLREMESSRMSSPDENIKILCQVADILETPPEYETAIEAVLGDRLGAAVVGDNDEIARALRHLKAGDAKRSGFITLNPAGSRIPGRRLRNFDGKEGVIGRAAGFVSVRKGFDKVAASLLHDVVLVDSLERAVSFLENADASEDLSFPCFATLDGDVLEPSGMVFGGSDKGVLKIKRLIKELERDIEGTRERIAEAERLVAGLRDEIVSAENEIISIDGVISSREKYGYELKVKAANLEEENLRLRRKQEYISTEISDDHREKDRLKNALIEKENLCRTLEREKQEIEESIRAVRNTIADGRETLETMRSELTEVKLRLASAGEKMSSIKRDGRRLNAALLEIDRKKEDILKERDGITRAIDAREQEIREKEAALKTKIVRVGELQARASEINEALGASTAELEVLEAQAKELSSELENLRGEISRIEMKKMEQSMKLDYLKEDIMKTYSVDIGTVDAADTVSPEEEETLPRLKEKLRAIGPVSLGALDEYEELKQRYEFMVAQRDDLLASIEDLEETIRKINRTSRKRLEEAFEALNEKFREVFTVLFGGGRAELRLTEGSILDAGIEIIAQPPGKRLQNMNLLSGGEKALTAISLLFAGFMIKPTPLCLLDEVDAPLDESNTDRFIDLLKKLARDIQFIAITHNRRTMEAGDYLYGITMEEAGVSKVVSMHLAEAV